MRRSICFFVWICIRQTKFKSRRSDVMYWRHSPEPSNRATCDTALQLHFRKISSHCYLLTSTSGTHSRRKFGKYPLKLSDQLRNTDTVRQYWTRPWPNFLYINNIAHCLIDTTSPLVQTSDDILQRHRVRVEIVRVVWRLKMIRRCYRMLNEILLRKCGWVKKQFKNVQKCMAYSYPFCASFH